MMAVVAAIGSVILFQGLLGIQSFNNVLNGFMTSRVDSTSESLIIEHVRFNSTSSLASNCPNPPVACKFTISIWFRNVGTVDSKITSIKILNMSDQTLVSYQTGLELPVNIKSTNYVKFNLLTGGIWSLSNTANYKVSIVTDKGNSFNMVAKPYNT